MTRHTPIIILIAIFGMFQACSGDEKEVGADGKTINLDMRSDSLAQWASYLSLDSQGVAQKLKTRQLGNYAEVFNDSNYVHWEAATKIGIEPIEDLRSYWQLKRPMVKVVSCEHYVVDPLTHSQPYLVPEAAKLIEDIGRRFRDTLQARGGGDYRICVTSVLRTPDNVRKLRRRNANAVESSVHQLGTTVDISYSSFAANSYDTPRTVDDLKAVLAEVLYDLRQEGRCLVKYERKQPCFHISAIKGR